MEWARILALTGTGAARLKVLPTEEYSHSCSHIQWRGGRRSVESLGHRGGSDAQQAKGGN
jgi:hypothetical protein